MKIGLVGGGLAGSLLAVYMARKGHEVHLFERRPDMRSGQYEGGRSINLALSMRGLKALEKVGLDVPVLEQAIPMHGRMMHDLAGNLTYQPYGKDGQAINSVSRGGLNIQLIQLADAYPNIHLYFRHRCTHADLDTASATFETEDGSSIAFQGDYLIGTDGAYSAVRDAFQRSNRFNYSQSYIDHGYKELEILPGPGGTFAMEKHCLHIWPRASYMLIALPNPDGSFTCTLFFPWEGNPSFTSLDSDAKIKAFMEEQFPDAVKLMPNYLRDFNTNPTGSLVTVRSYPWVRGKAALLGDAAHAIVPFYGQGMNCAFEDCRILDECMDRHPGNMDAALQEYQVLRKTNADAVADLALQNFVEMRDLVGDPAFLHRKHVEHDLAEMYPDRFRSQYELVSFSNEPYRYAWDQGVRNGALLDYLIDNKLEDKLGDRAMLEPLFDKFL